MGPARGAIGELPRRIFSRGAESPAAVDRKFLASVIDRRSIGPGERLRLLKSEDYSNPIPTPLNRSGSGSGSLRGATPEGVSRRRPRNGNP